MILKKLGYLQSRGLEVDKYFENYSSKGYFCLADKELLDKDVEKNINDDDREEYSLSLVNIKSMKGF